jgi:hypothetical protein
MSTKSKKGRISWLVILKVLVLETTLVALGIGMLIAILTLIEKL